MEMCTEFKRSISCISSIRAKTFRFVAICIIRISELEIEIFFSPHVLLFHEIAFHRISCGTWFLYHIKHHHFSTSLQLDVISNVWVGLHCKLRNHKSILCHELNIATMFQYCPQYGIIMENCFLIFQMILSFFTSNFPIIQCIIITSFEMPIYLM